MIKRYDYETDGMHEHSHGDYLSFEDHEAAMAYQAERVDKLVEALKLSIHRACAQCSADRIAHVALANYEKDETSET